MGRRSAIAAESRALVLRLFVAALLASPVPAIVGAGPVRAGTCPRFGDPEVLGSIGDDRINEVSGIVAARRVRGVLWMHEDSGNGTWAYAITPKGRMRADVEVIDAWNWDWEDVALADGRLWIGDIGDNARARDRIRVYWFREPASLDRERVSAKVLWLRYPDQAHNAEAMIVDGRRERLFVFEKQRGEDTSRVYAVGLRGISSGDERELKLVARAPLENITAADLGPDGIVLKNYSTSLFIPWVDRRVVATLRRGTRCPVSLPSSEAVAFSRSGGRIYSIPEGPDPEVSAVERR